MMNGRTLLQNLGMDATPTELLVAILIGVVLGAASIFVKPQYVIFAVLGIAGVLIILKRPELAFIGILYFTSSINTEAAIPYIETGPFILYLPDLIIVFLLVIIVLRWLVERDFKFARTPLNLPFAVFYGGAALSTVLGLIRQNYHQDAISSGISEVRTIGYYFLFFLAVNLLRDEKQIRLLMKAFFLLATVVAGAMVLQYILGQSVEIITGRVESYGTLGASRSEVTRITNFEGESTILVALVARTAILAMRKFKAVRLIEFVQWGILVVAVVITFNRNFWFGVGLSMVMLAVLLRGEDRERAFRWGTVSLMGLIAVIAISAALPDSKISGLSTAAFDRFSSLFVREEYAADSQESSLRWRDFEYSYAFPQIMKQPILGLGLGSPYRPFVVGRDWENFQGIRYVHNAHIWILVKTGLIGYGAFFVISVMFVIRGLLRFRYAPSDFLRGTMLGFSLVYMGVMIGAIVNPMFMQWYWTPVIGMMMGVNEAIINLSPDPNEVALDTGSSQTGLQTLEIS